MTSPPAKRPQGDNPQGQVISISDQHEQRRALVSVDAAAVCPRCAEGKGCGAGLLGSSRRPRQLEARIARGVDIAAGDTVGIELAPRHILQAAVIVYGWPLLGAGVGAVAAWFAGLGDAAAAVLALTGVLAGMWLVRWRLARGDCLGRFTPVIVERLRAERLRAPVA